MFKNKNKNKKNLKNYTLLNKNILIRIKIYSILINSIEKTINVPHCLIFYVRLYL